MSKAAQRKTKKTAHKKRTSRPTRRTTAKPQTGAQPAGPQATPQQVVEGLAAVLEVVSGAPSHRILELGPKIEIGKGALRNLIGQIAAGVGNAEPAADQ